MRICSLLPSATEIVFSLGLEENLVAVTHECDYPPQVARLPIISRSTIDHSESSSRDIHHHVSKSVHQGSSLYELDRDLLKKLDPDLILTQELCPVCAVSYREVRAAVRVLEGEPKVLSLEPTDLEEILQTIDLVGQLTGRGDRAGELIGPLRRRIESVAQATQGAAFLPRVFAMEWVDPPFAGGHWVPEMIRLAGGQDGLGKEQQPSFEVSWQQIAGYDPEIIVLMPCGFNLHRALSEFQQMSFSPQWSRLNAVRSGRVYVVDGSSYFNRPGPRIVDGLEILAEILHPELFPRTQPPEAWQKV